MDSISSSKSSRSARSRSARSSFSSVGATSEIDGNGYLPTSNDLVPMGRPIDTSMADCGYVHHIVLDCSAIFFIDTVGAKILKQVWNIVTNLQCILIDTSFIFSYSNGIFRGFKYVYVRQLFTCRTKKNLNKNVNANAYYSSSRNAEIC